MSKKGRDYILYLEDIVIAIDKIERYTHGLTFEQFCKNDIVIDAIIRNFEVIGEAAKNIPDNVKRKYNHVEWRETVGFRNILIHNYFGIDVESLWDTIKNNIPILKENMKKVLQNERSQ